MATTNVQSAGGIFIAVDADVAPFYSRIAATASQAKTAGDSIGQALGQGITSAVQRSVAPLPGLIFSQVQRTAAAIPGIVFAQTQRAAAAIPGINWQPGRTAAPIPGVTFGQSRNMAADMGLGNNFVFAIQDATSAVGQFGFTTTALRFAILGATNNIQIMVMQAALAGVTFRTLLSFITPLHIGLALFSAGISLLPLLFMKTSSEVKKTTRDITDLDRALSGIAETGRLNAIRESLGVGPAEKPESGFAKREQTLVGLIDQLNHLKAELSGQIMSQPRMGHPEDLLKIFQEESRIRKEIRDTEKQIASLREQQAKATAERLRREEVLSGGRPGSIYEGITKKGIDALNADVESIIKGMEIKTNEELAKESQDRFRTARDFPLQMQRLDMELARLQKDQFTTKFESPESIVKSIQAEADSGIERNQEKQIRLQEIQNQKADLIIDTIKKTGGLPGLAFILP